MRMLLSGDVRESAKFEGVFRIDSFGWLANLDVVALSDFLKYF